MSKFEFNAAIYVRAYGTITVTAETLDDAKAAMVADGFNMGAAFAPHGGGENDLDYDCDNQGITLNAVTVDGGDEIELDQELLDANELALQEDARAWRTLQSLGVDGTEDPCRALVVAIAGLEKDSDGDAIMFADEQGDNPLHDCAIALAKQPTSNAAALLDFVKRMADFTTPEGEFNAVTEAGEKLRSEYADADEYQSDLSDDRLCDEFGAFVKMIEWARELVKS